MFTDAEGALKTYLRGLPDTPWAQRVFFGVPKQKTPTMPLLVVGRIGGGPQFGETPLEDVRLSIDCWGIAKQQAADTMRALTTAIFDLASTDLDDETVALNGSVDSVVWLPDDTVGLSRYSVDVTLTLKVR